VCCWRSKRQSKSFRNGMRWLRASARSGPTSKASLSPNGELMARWRGVSLVRSTTRGGPAGRQQTRAKRMMAGASRLGASLCCRLSQLASPITHVIGQARPRCRIAAGSRPAFAVECGTRTPRVRFGPTPTPPAKGSGGQGIGRPRDRAAKGSGSQGIGRPTIWGYVRRL
jgi:hypothetical protein